MAAELGYLVIIDLCIVMVLVHKGWFL